MAGDISMVAPRRMLAQAMSRFEDHVYSYRWDVAALNTSTTIGVQHFAEVGRYSSHSVSDHPRIINLIELPYQRS